jgi:hydrogenase maturation protease
MTAGGADPTHGGSDLTHGGAVLIGMGNPYRRDDGVGPVIAAAVHGMDLPGVRTLAVHGETSDLLHAWTGARLAIVVDAVRRDPAQPGRIHRFDGAPPAVDGVPASTHGLALAHAVQLAELLDLEPDRLLVFAVEAADLGHGEGLSPAVAAAVPRLLALVTEELGYPAGR